MDFIFDHFLRRVIGFHYVSISKMILFGSLSRILKFSFFFIIDDPRNHQNNWSVSGSEKIN